MSQPVVTIHYCPGCRWLARAAWMAQEFLQTFESELGGVTLAPGASGEFRISLEGADVFDRADEGGFVEIKLLKQRLRDRLNPEKPLGHGDG